MFEKQNLLYLAESIIRVCRFLHLGNKRAELLVKMSTNSGALWSNITPVCTVIDSSELASASLDTAAVADAASSTTIAHFYA